MDDVIDILTIAARRCECAVKAHDDCTLVQMRDRLVKATQEIAESFGGSWAGYQATIYKRGFAKARSGERHDPYFHNDPSWASYQYESVEEEIKRRANVPDLQPFLTASKLIGEAFDASKREVLPVLDAVLSSHSDQRLSELRDEIRNLENHISRSAINQSACPRQQYITDPAAVEGGPIVPPHVQFNSWLMERFSYANNASELAEKFRYTARYLEQKLKFKGKTVAKTEGKIFIGHGRAAAWMELQKFLEKKLNLETVEFNSESAAGLTNKERLQAMLDSSCFGFVVMTAEDQHADSTLHARENVIHEAGLFQGRLGFERAIILLEEGVKEFSNIHGLTHISFPKGQIKAAYEEVRDVLRREKIIK